MWTRVCWISCCGKSFLIQNFVCLLKLGFTTTFIESVTALLVQVKRKFREKQLCSEAAQPRSRLPWNLFLSLVPFVGSFTVEVSLEWKSPPLVSTELLFSFSSQAALVANERKINLIPQPPMSNSVFKLQVCFELGKGPHRKVNWIPITN